MLPLSSVATLTFATVAPFVAGAIALFGITGVLLASVRSQCAARTVPGAVVFRRSPRLPLLLLGIAALCIGALPFIGIDGQNGLFVLAVVVAGVGFMFGVNYLGYALVYFVADGTGFTRGVLAFQRTLPWHEVDWVYPEHKVTAVRIYGLIKVAQFSEDSMVLEAGPRRRIRVLLKAWGIGGDTAHLLRAIEEHATAAEFGHDRSPFVLQRRTALAGVPARGR